MKKLLTTVSTLLLASLLTLSAFAQTETLTNDEVIAMLNAGLTPTVIVNKIRTSKTKFDLSTRELIRLKQAGLTEDILTAMQGYSESTDAGQLAQRSREVSTRVANDPNDPMTKHDIGIYLYAEHGNEKKMTELEPVAVTSGRAAGMAGTRLTYGLWMTKNKIKIAGSSANFQTREPQPVFYFYLNEKDRSMTTVKYFPANVNQFQMVKFSVKGKGREITVGKSNSYSSKTGIPDDDLVEFSYEKVGDGIFKVTPKKVLKAGEYGFYLLGTGESIGATFYDFSVNPLP